MTIETLSTWETEAATAADALCARLNAMPSEGLTLDLVDSAHANGSNSLDELFFGSLEAGQHLTDKFLANI